jgi:hypothetical protein
MLDPNGAKDRQLNSRNSRLALIRVYPCPSVVKEKALRFFAFFAASALNVDGWRLNFREGFPNMR